MNGSAAHAHVERPRPLGLHALHRTPAAYPFIHALDTKRGVAHCIQLPWEQGRNQNGLYNLVLDRCATAAARSR